MKISEDTKTGEVIIDDKRIGGFIVDSKCVKCNNYEVYCERYDAYFCAFCNEWLEEKCSDHTCYFCKDRPDKPL